MLFFSNVSVFKFFFLFESCNKGVVVCMVSFILILLLECGVCCFVCFCGVMLGGDKGLLGFGFCCCGFGIMLLKLGYVLCLRCFEVVWEGFDVENMVL